MVNLPFNHVKEGIKVSHLECRGSIAQPTRLQSGTPSSPSIVSTCLEELGELKAQGIDEATIRDLSAGVYVGGADTVSSSYLTDRSIVIDCQILAPRGASEFYSRNGAPPTRLEKGAGGD